MIIYGLNSCDRELAGNLVRLWQREQRWILSTYKAARLLLYRGLERLGRILTALPRAGSHGTQRWIPDERKEQRPFLYLVGS